MKNSTVLYILGVPNSIVGLLTLFRTIKLFPVKIGVLLFFGSILILWLGVFVEGIEDGMIGLDVSN